MCVARKYIDSYIATPIDRTYFCAIKLCFRYRDYKKLELDMDIGLYCRNILNLRPICSL